ncbi:aromatic prenyltransferase, partial [Dactylonectria macrodidyma]
IWLKQWLPSRDSRQVYWWNVTGQHLAAILHHADYPLSRQYEYLLFYYFTLVPHMGLKPTSSGAPRFNSFMTDDFSPIEYSWKWPSSSSDSLNVRLSMEIIGPDAGTAFDPYNQSSTIQLLNRLSDAFPGIDITWFNQF